jgi:hypothetical protein
MTRNGWRDGHISVRKITVSGKIPVQYVVPAVAEYATGALLAGKDFNAATTALGHRHLLKQPAYAMPLIVCAGAAGTAGHNDYLKIGGYKADGTYVYENVYVKGTATGTTCSSNAFAAIDYIKPYGQTSANTRPKSTKIGIGYQPITVGLPYPIASNDDIITFGYGTTYASTAFQELTISSTYNTVTVPAVTAGKSLNFVFKSKLQK